MKSYKALHLPLLHWPGSEIGCLAAMVIPSFLKEDLRGSSAPKEISVQFSFGKPGDDRGGGKAIIGSGD